MRRFRDLEIVAAASVICALVALVIPVEAIRFAFAVPLALFLPGYAIVSTAFAGRSLSWARFCLLSIALSLTTLILGALVLDYVPGGIRSLSWALLLVIVVLAACRSANLRRPPADGGPEWPRIHLTPAGGGLIGAGAVLAVAAIVLAMTTLPAKNAVGFTQLWIVPRANAERTSVEVGVGSDEQQAVAYRLEVRIAGRPAPAVSHFTLAPGETRETVVSTGPPPPAAVRIVALLFRQYRPHTVYRRVSAWIPSARTSP